MAYDEISSALHTLERVYLTYTDNLWKYIGFLLLVFGWLITSESARAFLGSHVYVKTIFLIVLTISVFAWIFVCLINYSKSKSLGKFLSTHNVNEPIYNGLQIHRSILVINIFIIIFLVIIIGISVVAI